VLAVEAVLQLFGELAGVAKVGLVILEAVADGAERLSNGGG